MNTPSKGRLVGMLSLGFTALDICHSLGAVKEAGVQWNRKVFDKSMRGSQMNTAKLKASEILCKPVGEGMLGRIL